MEAYLDWQSKSGGIKLNDVIEEYKYVANGKSVKEGDFLTYVEGVALMEEVTKTGNIFPTSWTATTAPTKYGSASGYKLEATYTDGASNYAFYISDGNTNTQIIAPSGFAQEWGVTMTCPNPTKITKMNTYIDTLTGTTAVIKGSKDGSKWEDLATITSKQYGLREVVLENTDYYTYYKIYASLNSASKISIFEWQTSEYIEKVIETEQQVTPATQPPFNALALSSGVGGTDTEHNEQVKIARVASKLSMLPVGSLVKDTNSTFLGKPVIWKIADKNHKGYPDGSVTLITERSIALRAFDAKEPNNSNTSRQKFGNNRYSVSNIRQWLNSDAAAGQWYSAQHSADQEPSSDYVYNSVNAYADDVGFLNGFSENFRNSLLDTTLITALNTVTDGGGSEKATDKIFLASTTEVGLVNENGIAEGKLLPIFSDNTSRIAYCTTEAIVDSNYTSNPANENTAWHWSLRTPTATDSYNVHHVYTDGSNTTSSGDFRSISAVTGFGGIRPLCNIPSTTIVSDTPDADGCYTLFVGGEA